MNDTSTRRDNPFTIRSALVLVVIGSVLLIALLWMIGTGLGMGKTNDGGGHGAGKGLNGYAAFYRLLEEQGHQVSRGRSNAALQQEALLVLTPPHGADAEEISQIISDHRWNGPTLLILPKWGAAPIPRSLRPKGAKDGWVMLGEAASPEWAAKLENGGSLDARIDPGNSRWSGLGLVGSLPQPKAVQTISAGAISALVRDSRGQALAALVDDGNDYGALSAATDAGPGTGGEERLYPLVIVAEPDLLNNYGFAKVETAQLASALITAMTEGEAMPIVFDLTLNGHGQQTNLLTLAFTPPFLAATLCLLLAALAIGWRAFVRFGPPRRTERAIAFGKRALVANSAGLIRRTRRLHLLTGPYADRASETISHALAIARQPDRTATEAAIDRALQSRGNEEALFSQTAERLRNAKTQQQAVHAAHDLHALERNLIG